MKVNLGCGPSPTAGWINIDNSPTVRLAKFPLVTRLIGRRDFVDKARASGIQYGTAINTGLPTASADVVYSSHMLEHLDREEAQRFLQEARRVIKPGGILRIAVPDLTMLIEHYQKTGDANAFMNAMCLELDKPKSLSARLKFALLTGFRLHHWMYDAKSLKQLIEDNGFVNATILEAGQTMIADPGELDLREREEESIYLEAIKPAQS